MVVFPRTLKDTIDSWVADKILLVSGKPQEKDGEMKILVDTAFELTPQNIDEVAKSSSNQVAESTPTPPPLAEPMKTELGVIIHVRASLPETILIHLRRAFDAHVGLHQVYFLIDDVEGQRRIKASSKVTFSEDFVAQIEQLLGKGTVKIG